MSNPEREARLKEERYWLDTIMTEGLNRLDNWEENFVNNMQVKLDSSFNTLTTAQHDKLKQIYERITK